MNFFSYKTLEEIKAENTHNDNLFGLVYSDAITENTQGEVNIYPISYPLNGLKIAANVYTPAGYEERGSYPAIVVAHPNGGVKEQVAGKYAQLLAENGYITLAFDAAYQGGSEGLPRNTDKPANRVEDIFRAADIITHFPGVNPERIGILGICGGGGYTFKAAQSDKRYKAVATLSAFNTGLVRRNGFLDGQVNTIHERLMQAAKARQQEMDGGDVLYTANMLDAPESILDTLAYDLYRDGYCYYGQTHRHPNSTFAYTVSSNMELMAWDASDGGELINQPLLMIAGSVADTLYLTEKMFAAATGTKDKELFLIPGATHIQTYWKQPYVDQVLARLVTFFGDKL